MPSCTGGSKFVSSEVFPVTIYPSLLFLEHEMLDSKGSPSTVPCGPAGMNISDQDASGDKSSHFDGTLEYAMYTTCMAHCIKSRATADALRAIRQKRHFIFTRCAMNLRL